MSRDPCSVGLNTRNWLSGLGIATVNDGCRTATLGARKLTAAIRASVRLKTFHLGERLKSCRDAPQRATPVARAPGPDYPRCGGQVRHRAVCTKMVTCCVHGSWCKKVPPNARSLHRSRTHRPSMIRASGMNAT